MTRLHIPLDFSLADNEPLAETRVRDSIAQQGFTVHTFTIKRSYGIDPDTGEKYERFPMAEVVVTN